MDTPLPGSQRPSKPTPQAPVKNDKHNIMPHEGSTLDVATYRRAVAAVAAEVAASVRDGATKEPYGLYQPDPVPDQRQDAGEPVNMAAYGVPGSGSSSIQRKAAAALSAKRDAGLAEYSDELLLDALRHHGERMPKQATPVAAAAAVAPVAGWRARAAALAAPPLHPPPAVAAAAPGAAVGSSEAVQDAAKLFAPLPPPSMAQTAPASRPHAGAAAGHLQGGGASAPVQQPPPQAPALSAAEWGARANKFAAKAMKAKLRGDIAAHAKHAAEADRCRGAATGHGGVAAGGDSGHEEVVMIAPLDAAGRMLPSFLGGDGATPRLERDDTRTGAKKGKRKEAMKVEQGTGMGDGYFPADVRAARGGEAAGDEGGVGAGGPSLEDMVRAERTSGRRGADEEYAANILRMGKRFKVQGVGVDARTGQAADEDSSARGAGPLDMRMFQSEQERLTGQAAAAKDRARAVAETRKWQSTTSHCQFCLDSERFKGSLLLALGKHCVLMLPPWPQLVEGHCLIVPRNHSPSMTLVDEDAYREANAFKAALFQTFAQDEAEPLFLELGGKEGARNHGFVQCIPLPKNAAEDAPIFFHKALSEAEEWTTNKAIVDCAGRGLRGAVPPGFPYFHVGWRGGGYAHVIEDATTFPKDWGVDIAAGMLGLPPGGWGRKQNRTDSSQDAARVQAFYDKFKPFDPTA